MTPQRQTRLHPNGDCLRACIASLLDLPISHVPDWTIESGCHELHDSGYPKFYLAMQTWLAQRNYAYVEIQLEGQPWNPLPYETACILIGRHESGARHAIVGRCEGDSFFSMFDPLGAKGVESFADGMIRSVAFLVPMDPVYQQKWGAALERIYKMSKLILQPEISQSIQSEAREALGLTERIILLEPNERPPRMPPANGSKN